MQASPVIVSDILFANQHCSDLNFSRNWRCLLFWAPQAELHLEGSIFTTSMFSTHRTQVEDLNVKNRPKDRTRELCTAFIPHQDWWTVHGEMCQRHKAPCRLLCPTKTWNCVGNFRRSTRGLFRNPWTHELGDFVFIATPWKGKSGSSLEESDGFFHVYVAPCTHSCRIL